MIGVLEDLAALSIGRGDGGRAARLYGCADSARAERGLPEARPDEGLRDRDAKACTRRAIGDAAFDLATAEGASLSVDQMVEEVLAEPVAVQEAQ